MPLEWTTTVAGAVLCVAYGWWLASIARDKIVWIGRAAPLISVVGTVILAGMAMSGHADVAEPVGAVPEYTIVAALESVVVEEAPEDLLHSKSLLSMSLAVHGVGPRPSADHVVYNNANGKSVWITKEDYKALLSERRKGGD